MFWKFDILEKYLLVFQIPANNNGFKNASLAVFLNNHKSFKKLNIETLVKKMKKPAIIIDTWNQIDKSKFDKFQNFRYSGLGND